MSNIANPDATGLGITGKIFQERSGGRRLRNLVDTGEVFLLASEIADGNARRASLVSIDELRAIATLATCAGVVLHAALELLEASDANAPADDIRAKLVALCAVTRALTTREKSQ